MPSSPAVEPRPSAVVNADIRRLCEVTGVWTREDLAELARLTGEWRAAVAREAELAA